MAPILVLAAAGFARLVQAQSSPDESRTPPGLISSLQLDTQAASELQKAIEAHDYITAEKLLLAEIDHDAHSPRTARLLAYVGTVYFANQDYLNAAVAWKKSEAIAPLDTKLRFSLAMAYVRLVQPDWARTVLESLARENEKDALYPYWLGRLDYDGHFYHAAIKHFGHAIELDPKFARAYDNLGLCYYYENQNDLAVANFQKAIELERVSANPSPWPYLNLGITQQFLNQLPESEKSLREALRVDPDFIKAHFQLGTVLEDRGQPGAALAELKEAARLDPSYPEPHMAMARIYRKIGQEAAARAEVKTYLRLHPHANP
ncbi:MAG TPA: tetratricopeptide repeat protein [Terracidiphilus sp.]|jgi:superkiller protein 3